MTTAERRPEGRRLHPAGVVFSAIDVLSDNALALLILIIVGGGVGSVTSALGFALLGILAAIVSAIVTWSTTTFSVGEQGITFVSGVVAVDQKLVPRARISSVDVVEGPLQRAFGVVELHVHAAGGTDAAAEIVLKVLTRADADAVARQLGHPPSEDTAARWTLSGRALLATALTAPSAGVLIPVAAGVAGLAQQLLSSGGESLLPDAPEGRGEIMLAVALLVAVTGALSIAGSVVAYAGFEARREGDRILIRRGLLRRRAGTVALRRIHGVAVVENPLRQPFGLASVRVETVAHGNQPAEGRTLLPLVRRSEIAGVLAALAPGIEPPSGDLSRPPRRAARRYALAPAALAGAIGGAAAIAAPVLWPLVPALALLGAAIGLWRFADAGWRADGDRVTIRRRRLARSTLTARADRLQQASVLQSVLQRRAGLASSEVVVGAGRRGVIEHLELADARRVIDACSPAASPG